VIGLQALMSADARQVDLLAVLDERLAGAPRRDRPVSPTERIGSLLSAAARARAESAPIDPDVAALLRLIGFDLDDTGGAVQLAADAIEASAAGFGRADVPLVIQAYTRGVGRIVAAEAQAVVGLVRGAPEEERPAQLSRALDALLPVTARGFEVVHRQLLYDALRSALVDGEIDDPQSGHLAVAMIDFVGSTRYLINTGPEELEELVDLLFEGAQWATAQRRARVVKYVGDGVFLCGPDAGELAEVTLDLVGLLEAGSPLRARGGIAFGHVVQRAGDIFGLPVNGATILTKAARPGTVIADEAAAEGIPRALRARPRRVVLPHPALGRATVVTVRRR